jgi:hypothetical protein
MGANGILDVLNDLKSRNMHSMLILYRHAERKVGKKIMTG